MVRIAPVRLTLNPKTLWFDAGELALSVGDDVVVETARGAEFGTVAKPVFDMAEEETVQLKSPLKPVKRIASDEDRAVNEERMEAAKAALPVFRSMAEETTPEMNPVAVEYLFDGDKAVFYFESEDRIDFRELVRKLAAEFHVRVDMKQIGVRDSARMIGGLGHCGQELCCRRLGGEFNPVSIRMAKEQDLSLNPAKISGTCGRLMCCLRYEYDAYKDFHSQAPKKNAQIQTPDGEGKVVDMDVPREVISVKVGEEKPVKVPLADFEPVEEGKRPNVVGEDAWARANEPATFEIDSAFGLFTNQLTGEDQLAKPGSVTRTDADADTEKPQKSRSRRRGGSAATTAESAAAGAKEAPSQSRKPRRRRSTTVKVEGEGESPAPKQKEQPTGQAKSASRRRSRNRPAAKAQDKPTVEPKKNVQVGRKSSALRAGRQEAANAASAGDAAAQNGGERKQASGGGRRRRRSHKTASEGASAQE